MNYRRSFFVFVLIPSRAESELAGKGGAAPGPESRTSRQSDTISS